MVCGKCEAKLTQGAVPDVWKSGSLNAGAGRDGGKVEVVTATSSI